MYVIYKVNMNEREADEQFPKLKRFFKREIVEENCENPHLSLAKWMNDGVDKGYCYSVGIIK